MPEKNGSGTVYLMSVPSMFVSEVGVLPENTRLGRYLRSRGVRNEWCVRTTLKRGRYPIDPTVLVSGSVQYVHAALEMLGCAIPEPLGFPAEIEPWLFRTVARMSATEAAELATGTRVFIKPAGELKAFTGGLSDSDEVAEALRKLPGTTPVFVADEVEFVAEWRCFVVEGEIRAVAQYMPDIDEGVWLPPSDGDLQDLVTAAWSACGRAAISVDVGVLPSGDLALVELNDGYALGSYGIPDQVYFDVLWSRWQQMVAAPAVGGRVQTDS